jgi:hypothetical protein
MQGEKAKKPAATKQKDKASSDFDSTGLMEVAQPIVSGRAARDDNARRAAVIKCVNGALNANRPGWNDDGHGNGRAMDKDFHYDVHSMPAFLGAFPAVLRRHIH